MKSFLKQVEELYRHLSIATAVFERDEDGVWQHRWQNDAAHSTWGTFDIISDPVFKLELMDALSQVVPSVFDYQIPGAIEKYRFIATPHENALLIQFLASRKENGAGCATGEEKTGIHSLIIESSAFGIYDWDIEKDFVQLNQKAHEVFGVNGTIIGSSYNKLISRICEKDVEAVVNAIDDHLQHKWPLNVEFRILNNKQQFEWIYMTGQAQWQDDKPIRLAGTLTNISNRKQAEQQLRQRELLIEQMIDALPISIYVKDAQGCYRFFNKEAENLTGKVRGQMLGRTDFEAYPITFAVKQATKDKEIQSTEKVVLFEEEAQFNEQTHWMLHGKVPMHVKQFNQNYETWLLSFALDITERKKMEEELKAARNIAEQAAKAKADFLSVMSHEIRTPLNSVIGNASLLLSEDLDSHLAEHVEMIKRSGDHLLYLINDILDFNKLEAGKVQLEQRPFSLPQQVQTVIEMSVTNAKLKHIDLTSEISEELNSHYLGDEGRLRQVLLNLVGNAIKFTSSGGVAISVFPGKDFLKNNTSGAVGSVRFEVKDSGIGISEENIPKLFAEFSQADSSTSRRFGGSGLGLSISKKLVEAMNGEIGIVSTEGVGSTFWFEIPLKKSEEVVQTTAEVLTEELDIKPLSVLVAEDNLPNQFLIKTILSKLGHHVEIANNGLEAYEMMQDSNNVFDLVLMDMQMPEMNGLESTQQIRMLPGHEGNVPIIALSANSYEESYEAVIASGMNDYLSKPVNIEALKKTLAKWGSI